LEDISGNDLRSLDLGETTITEDNGLQGQSLFQFIDNRTCLVFLNETDSGVEHKQGANDTEINPILKGGGEKSGSLCGSDG
jgi:hypothetical protein